MKVHLFEISDVLFCAQESQKVYCNINMVMNRGTPSRREEHNSPTTKQKHANALPCPIFWDSHRETTRRRYQHVYFSCVGDRRDQAHWIIADFGNGGATHIEVSFTPSIDCQQKATIRVSLKLLVHYKETIGVLLIAEQKANKHNGGSSF